MPHPEEGMVIAPDPNVDLALRRYDTVFRYLASENAIFWTRSQLFLVANAALIGFVTKDLPSAVAQVSFAKLVMLILGCLGALLLCVLWHLAVIAGSNWWRHWHGLLETIEPDAFGEHNVMRRRPARTPRFRLIARSAAWLFTCMWIGVLGYLVLCFALKLRGEELP
jgi:lysylphosphatidylglycerol synthetase-like protein (DUF2156 family)